MHDKKSVRFQTDLGGVRHMDPPAVVSTARNALGKLTAWQLATQHKKDACLPLAREDFREHYQAEVCSHAEVT